MRILYTDKLIQDYEATGLWIEDVKYLYRMWRRNRNREEVFLRLATTSWYILTLDGLEISLTDLERQLISGILYECYEFFNVFFIKSDTCQWMFGYMMEVRPELFVNDKNGYDDIEGKGKYLIRQSSKQGNRLAQLVDERGGLCNGNHKNIQNVINESFNDSFEVDKYFIEILNMSYF